MSEQTVNIRIPDPLELQQYRIQVGDTVQFIEKMTGTQDDLDAFSGQLNLTVADMQSAANQITARYAQIMQTGQQVADDKSTVQQLRTEAGQDRQAAEQAATTAGQHLTATEQERQAAEQAATTAGQHLTATTQQRQLAEQAATTAGQHLTATAQERQGAEQAAGAASQAAQQAAQSAVEAGPTNLSFTRTSTTLTVQSSTGDDVVLPAATTTQAGLLSAADKVKIEAAPVAPVVTSFSGSSSFAVTSSVNSVTLYTVPPGKKAKVVFVGDTAGDQLASYQGIWSPSGTWLRYHWRIQNSGYTTVGAWIGKSREDAALSFNATMYTGSWNTAYSYGQVLAKDPLKPEYFMRIRPTGPSAINMADAVSTLFRSEAAQILAIMEQGNTPNVNSVYDSWVERTTGELFLTAGERIQVYANLPSWTDSTTCYYGYSFVVTEEDA